MKFVLCLAFFIVSAFADVSHIAHEPIPILKQSSDVGADGNYAWSYEGGNGIVAQEQGNVKSVGQEDISEVRGAVSYTAPDGQKIQLTYLANENGYQPQGDHLPVSPEIPEAIVKALRYIKDHPPPPEPAYHQKSSG